jgi:hypothetical protein
LVDTDRTALFNIHRPSFRGGYFVLFGRIGHIAELTSRGQSSLACWNCFVVCIWSAPGLFVQSGNSQMGTEVMRSTRHISSQSGFCWVRCTVVRPER